MSNIVRIDDYKGRPHYYDFGTKNDSFLLTARELKDLGIKNWYMCLEVAHPELGVQDMDPHDDNLSPQDIGKIIIECKHNPWYFFREVTRVPVSGAGAIPLYLHRAAHAAAWCFINSIDFELVQPRQTYKTTMLTCIMSYMMLFEYQNAIIPYMHKTETRCTDNVGLLRSYIQALPKYMNPWAMMKHPPGLQSLSYEAHNVKIAVVSAAKSESAAQDKMKGYSLYAAFVDECEIIPFMKQVMDGANPTVVQARITAKKMGIRSCMMYASTPGDLETDEGRDFQKIIDNLTVFTESMYDKTPEEIDYMKDPAYDPNNPDKVPVTMVYIEFDYIQLRKDVNYLRAQYFEALQKSTLGEYRRGVLLQRFRGENGAFFRQEDLDYIQMHMRQPDYHIDILGKYKLNVYKHQIRVPDLTSSTPYFDMSIPYLIGIDCATGKDGDNSAFCIVHPYTLEVVGELISPLMGGLDLMRTVTVLAKMLPRALFCIESNMTGVDVIDFVQESQLENRVYHGKQATELTKNVIAPNDIQTSLQQKATAKKYFGTYVGTKTRKMMFNILRDTVKDYRHLIYTQQLVHDIVNLVQQKNGNMAATSGEHDDMVMAYLHTLYILKYGEDLNRFGIDKNKCTFDKQKEIMDEYNQSVAEESVNNAIGLVPGTYEEQLYRDLTQRIHAEYSNPGDVDDYGYRRDQYQQSGDLKPTPSGTLTSSQLAFFREVNSYGYDDDMYGNPYACVGGSPYGYNNGNNGFGGGSPFGCF